MSASAVYAAVNEVFHDVRVADIRQKAGAIYQNMGEVSGVGVLTVLAPI